MRASTDIEMVAYISGFKSRSGFLKVQRTLAVRLVGSSIPLTQSTFPSNSLSGYATTLTVAGEPTVTRAMSSS